MIQCQRGLAGKLSTIPKGITKFSVKGAGILILAILTLPFQTVRANQAIAQRIIILQRFEHGLMFSSGDVPQYVEVITSEGLLLSFDMTKMMNLPPNPLIDLPPAGGLRPSNPFDKIWGNVPEIRQRLGWAVEPVNQFLTPEGGGWAGGYRYLLPNGNMVITQDLGSIAPFVIKFRTLTGSVVQATNGEGWLETSSGVNLIQPWVRRVQFASGTMSASVGGRFGSNATNKSASLILWARAGQKMTISLLTYGPSNVVSTNNKTTELSTEFIYGPDKVSSVVAAPSGAILGTSEKSPETIFDGVLPQSGDYSITISKAVPEYTVYELTITIV